MKISQLLFILFMFTTELFSQENFIENLLKTQPIYFEKILKNQSKYEVQIVYTQINRDKKNKPTFITHTFQTDANQYFYPASTVKLPASILALEKVNRLKIKGLTKYSAMVTGADSEKQTQVLIDSSAQNGLPSIAHYIKKILLVSDNDAFNRLYEFIGQKELNDRLHSLGFQNTNIVHRLEANLTAEQNKTTNPIKFFEGQNLLYAQKSQYNSENYQVQKVIKKGIGYLNSEGKLINEPLDFSLKNEFSIADQQLFLQKLMFPKNFSKKERFNLSKMDYDFIYRYMSMLPEESDFPKYKNSEYWPSYCKFLLMGSDSAQPWPQNIRIYNKVGDAYGYLIDNAYVVDYEHNIEFFLSAVIHCNEDQIFNDNKYEYDSIGLPFMKNLGLLFYDYEKKRDKKYLPKLLKMEYK